MFSPRNAHEQKQFKLCSLEVSHNSSFKITSLLHMGSKSFPIKFNLCACTVWVQTMSPPPPPPPGPEPLPSIYLLFDFSICCIPRAFLGSFKSAVPAVLLSGCGLLDGHARFSGFSLVVEDLENSWISLDFRSRISRPRKYLKTVFGPWKYFIFCWTRSKHIRA